MNETKELLLTSSVKRSKNWVEKTRSQNYKVLLLELECKEERNKDDSEKQIISFPPLIRIHTGRQ